MREPRRNWAAIASASVVKAVFALALMAVFFVSFFLAPAATLVIAALAVLLVELVRHA